MGIQILFDGVHHGFCSHPIEYPWTSYITSISEKPTKLKRDEVIKLFNDTKNFKQQHNHEIDIATIEKWLEIAPSDFHDFDLNLSKHESDADRSDADMVDADRSGDAVRSEEPNNVAEIPADRKRETNEECRNETSIE